LTFKSILGNDFKLPPNGFQRARDVQSSVFNGVYNITLFKILYVIVLYINLD